MGPSPHFGILVLGFFGNGTPHRGAKKKNPPPPNLRPPPTFEKPNPPPQTITKAPPSFFGAPPPPRKKRLKRDPVYFWVIPPEIAPPPDRLAHPQTPLLFWPRDASPRVSNPILPGKKFEKTFALFFFEENPVTMKNNVFLGGAVFGPPSWGGFKQQGFFFSRKPSVNRPRPPPRKKNPQIQILEKIQAKPPPHPPPPPPPVPKTPPPTRS